VSAKQAAPSVDEYLRQRQKSRLGCSACHLPPDILALIDDAVDRGRREWVGLAAFLRDHYPDAIKRIEETRHVRAWPDVLRKHYISCRRRP